MQDIFIIGCGYLGQKLAAKVFAETDELEIMALVRSSASNQRLQQLGIITIPGNLDNANMLTELPTDNTVLYYFAPPPATGTTDTRLQALLNALKPKQYPDKIVLVSTTGIYGDCGGKWIDEQHPVKPQTDRAQRRVDAETQLQAWQAQSGVPIVILRVPGIYGAERLPIERLQAGTPVLAEAESAYSNRIHIDDLVEACLLASEPDALGIYHVSDGNPSTMTDYFYQVADALNIARPPAISWAEAQQQFSPEMLSYLSESKRLKIDKICQELDFQPQYPTLKQGLQQCAKALAKPAKK